MRITLDGFGAIKGFTFPGGERHVYLPEDFMDKCPEAVTMVARLQSSDDIMDLLLITNALRKASPGIKISLTMPYVPYARQDRVAVKGEAFSAEVMASLINAQNYESVLVADPHSPVIVQLLDRVRLVDISLCVKTVMEHIGGSVALVAPDEGAYSRVSAMAKFYGVPMVGCAKVRDPNTGKLSGFQVTTPVPECKLLIVDDICDGGGTFLGIADALRAHTAEPIYLYVTHGIFSKGKEALTKKFEGLYVGYQWIKE